VRPYLEKNPSQIRACGVAQGVGPEFKPQHCKKKKKIVVALPQPPQCSDYRSAHHTQLLDTVSDLTVHIFHSYFVR
jgi:hypothetical protein